MIDRETIERIKDAAKVEEVVGDFVSLHRKGGNYWGCCPFHNEKTPSFSVSPAKGFFKCFGCGESGNAVGFLMKHEHYTYPEALQWLAKKYNIEIQEQELSEEQKQRNSERDVLYHVSDFAQQYFVSNLFDDEMGRAVGLSYFHKRGLNDDVIKAFGLGYCLDEWRAFTDHARKNGYSDTVLEKTGLTIFKEDGKYYDRFRGRVTFPIFSISGRVLGFSCRILTSDKTAAKYVNSPDSDIYNKGHILYGIYQAKAEIIRQDKCYLVEGNLDVVSMHQSGVKNTVASCGTALTTEQIRLIRRFTNNVTILYDGDAAGIKATKRAVNMLYSEGMKVRMVLFPDGEDPDSYALKYGSTQLQEYLRHNEENFILYKLRVASDDIARDPIRKAEFLKELVDTIALVPDLLERNEYVSQCASLLETSERALANQLAMAIGRNLQKDSKPAAEPSTGATLPPPAEADDYPGPLPLPEDIVPLEAAVDKAFNINDVGAAERHIIELLVNYGNNDIMVDVENENGEIERVSATVAQVVVADMMADDLEPHHPVCQKIYSIYREAVLQDAQVPTAAYFSNLDDDKVLQSQAIAFMTEPPELSPTWQKKGIYVKSIADNIKEDVRQAMLDYKRLDVQRQIGEIARQLKTASPDDQLILFAKWKALKDKHVEICSSRNLRRIIT